MTDWRFEKHEGTRHHRSLKAFSRQRVAKKRQVALQSYSFALDVN